MEHITKQEGYEQAQGPEYLMRLDIGYEKQEEGRILIQDLFAQHIEDNSVFEIRCNHIVAHVPNLKMFMEECWRILVPGGRMFVIVPYWTSLKAVEDYRHINRICENTFHAFSKKLCDQVGVKVEELKIDFDVLHIRYYFAPEFAALADQVKEYQRRHYLNTAEQIEVDLKAIK